MTISFSYIRLFLSVSTTCSISFYSYFLHQIAIIKIYNLHQIANKTLFLHQRTAKNAPSKKSFTRTTINVSFGRLKLYNM